MNELLIYGDINSWTSSEFIRSFALIESDNLVVRINTDGGSPEYGYGMIAKFLEFEGKKIVKVDGKANSTGAIFLAFADEVEALDVSTILIHRASYSEWYEESAYFTEEKKADLIEFNKNVYTAFKNKIDVAKFEALKGVKLKDVFSIDSRIDVKLSAKEAEQIGLITKVTKITPKLKAQLAAQYMGIAAHTFGIEFPASPVVKAKVATDNPSPAKTPQIKNTIMTLEELQASHPVIYAQVFKAGNEAGIKAERDRAGAWAAYLEVDSKKAKAGIDSGEPLSATATAEFNVLMASGKKLEAITATTAEQGAAAAADAPAAAPNAESDLKAQVFSGLGLNSQKN